MVLAAEFLQIGYIAARIIAPQKCLINAPGPNS